MNLRYILFRISFLFIPLLILLLFNSIRDFSLGLLLGSIVFLIEIFLLILPMNYLLRKRKKKTMLLFLFILSLLRWGIFAFLICFLIKILDISVSGVIIGVLICSVIFLALMVMGALRKE